jgi:uncharacterized protein
MKIWFDPTRYQDAWGHRKGDCCDSCDSDGPIRHNRALRTSSLYRPPCQEDLSSLSLHRLRLVRDLYIQPCDAGFWLVCHPTGSGQIAVMDTPALALLQLFQREDRYKAQPLRVMHLASFAELRVIHLFVTLGFLLDLDAPVAPVNEQRGQTLSAWIHVTNACNLRCHYCYIAKSSEHMTDNTSRLAVDAVIRSALKEGYHSIKLMYAGGEASLRLPQVLALHDYAVQQACEHDLELSARLLSNGVALTKHAIEQVKQRDISVMISLDGIGPAHDRQRPLLNGQGSFALVDRAISRLLEMQVVPSINATVSARNIAALPDLIAYLLERDLPFTLSYYRENDCSVSSPDLQYSEAQMILGMRAVFSYIEEHLPRRPLLNSLIDKGDMLSQGSHVCGVGRNYLVIDQRGGVAKCHADITQTVTTIHVENPLAEVNHHGSGMQAIAVDEKEGCQTCTWRYWCRGGCPTLTYRLTGRNDIRSPNCGIYQAIFPHVLRLEALRLLKYEKPLVLVQDERKDVQEISCVH